jgi:uncharacterized protein with HEPN domain
MAGTRDRLIHDYIGVNLDYVWDTITQDLPKLVPLVETLIDTVKAETNDPRLPE